MKVFGLKSCDTCRKALKKLEYAQLIDVRADGLPTETLDAALAQFGGSLVNTRSTTWRNLDDAERTRPARALLSEHPTLMKRPLIASEGRLYLGWTTDVQQALGVG
ncbi:MAG: ArsC/Spx/MgsR family protein [Pseudomonadota bacterium]